MSDKVTHEERPRVYWSSYWSYDGWCSEPIPSLRNSGLLARLESVNATIEPKDGLAKITLPNGKTFEFGGRYCFEAIDDVTDYLNSHHINEIYASPPRPDISSDD